MPASRHKALLSKSIDACLAAIEIYNKPDFRYREEAFSILMINAWELLLKARIIQQNRGSQRSIEIRRARTKADGSKTTRKYPVTNRSGNRVTVSIDEALRILGREHQAGIDESGVMHLMHGAICDTLSEFKGRNRHGTHPCSVWDAAQNHYVGIGGFASGKSREVGRTRGLGHDPSALLARYMGCRYTWGRSYA